MSHDVPHGKGVMKRPNGITLTGIWDNESNAIDVILNCDGETDYGSVIDGDFVSDSDNGGNKQI